MFMIYKKEKKKKSISNFEYDIVPCLIYYLIIELTQKERAGNGNHQDPIHHAILQVRANNQIEVVSLNGYICFRI